MKGIVFIAGLLMSVLAIAGCSTADTSVSEINTTAEQPSSTPALPTEGVFELTPISWTPR